MFTNILNFIRLKHYRHGRWLKITSAFQLILTIALIVLPFYVDNLLRIIASFKNFSILDYPEELSETSYLTTAFFSWIIAVLSGINLIKEYLLSRTQIVGLDYKREIIKQLLTLLMDNYGWKGSCRATLFVPNPNSEKIIIYERISAGIGPGGFTDKCFFRMNQGIPGKAWANSWAGDDGNEYSGLIKSIEIGIVPKRILSGKEKDIRSFFREKFGIIDDDIYSSLGEKKRKIASYMAVGILGRYNSLVGVLTIDSEDPEVFTDFEQLKNNGTGTFKQESNLRIEGNGEDDWCSLPALSRQILDLDIRKPVPVTQDWEDTKGKFKKFKVLLHASQAEEISIQAPGFLFPLGWVLKQTRDIFLMDSD
jgi:hypothetical protein